MNNINTSWFLGLAMTASLAGVAMAQGPDPGQASPSSGGWKKFGDQRPPDQRPPDQAPQYPTSPQAPQYSAPPQYAGPPPATLTLPAGSWLTVRVNQPL